MSRGQGSVREVATAFLRLRPLIVAPLMIATMATLFATGAPRARLVAVAALGGPVLAFFLFEAWQGARRAFREVELFRSLLLTELGIGGVALATGGAASPVLPMLLAPTGVGFAAFGRSRRVGWLSGGAAAVLLFSWVAPDPFGPIPEPARAALTALAILAAMLLLRLGVVGLSDAHARAAASLHAVAGEVTRATVGRAEALEALGAKVAHEVKNPLASVRALVEVLLEDASGRDRERLVVAASEVARIEQILGEYLSLQRPLGEHRPAAVDLGALLASLGLVLEAGASQREIELVVEHEAIAAGPGAWVDPTRLREALLNLALNALEASPPGARVTLRARPAEGERLRFEVLDAGRGMDAEVAARVGTAFFTTREGGTGLGVVLARQVAEQHGGHLAIESAPGRGTTATLEIPWRRPPRS